MLILPYYGFNWKRHCGDIVLIEENSKKSWLVYDMLIGNVDKWNCVWIIDLEWVVCLIKLCYK